MKADTHLVFYFESLINKDGLLLQNFEKLLGVHRRIDVLDKVSNETIN